MFWKFCVIVSTCFVRLTENLKLYNYMKLPHKNCQRTKENSIKILSNGPIYNEKLIAYKRYIKNTPIQWY